MTVIKAGLAFLGIGAILWVLAIPFAFAKEMFYLFPSAIVLGILGSILILIGVLIDRLKEKKEDDEDDLGQY
jgi:cadmium resistance protein CadD (predicted permease)